MAEKIADVIEPEAWLAGVRPPGQAVFADVIALSTAISLKRIADTLVAIQNEPCNGYGETALPALARAIKEGLRG